MEIDSKLGINNTEGKPLLTLGIPTFNRAHLLENLLSNIVGQLKEVDKERYNIEIVISDNASTDNTKDVAQDIIKADNRIKYFKNEENIGANNNILKIGFELALGKYCWILGDDDLIRANALNYILGILSHLDDVHVVYLNHTNESDDDRNRIIHDLPIVKNKIMCQNDSDVMLPNGEEVLSFTQHNALFTCVSSFIFLTDTWKNNFIGYQNIAPFDSVGNTFPHSVVLSQSIIKEKFYYVGYPYLAFFIGAQGWFNNWQLLLATRVLELADLFEKFGASKGFVDDYRNRIFKESYNAYSARLYGSNNPKWFDLNIEKNILRYSKYKEFRNIIKLLLYSGAKKTVKKIINILRFTNK